MKSEDLEFEHVILMFWQFKIQQPCTKLINVMEQGWNDPDMGKWKILEKILFQCHFANHRSDKYWPRIKPRSLQ